MKRRIAPHPRGSVARVTLATVAWVSLSAPPVAAEGFRVGFLKIDYVPLAELMLTGAEEDEVRSSATTISAKLALPVLLNGRRTILLNELTARLVAQTYEDGPRSADVYRPDRLWSFRGTFALRQELSEKWAAAVALRPVLSTDLEGSQSGQTMWQLGALVEWKASDHASWGFGVAYADEYGESKWLPLLRADWEPSPVWSVSIDIPRDVAVYRRISSRWSGGISAHASGADYYIAENVVLANGASTKGGRIKYSIVEVGPEATVRLSEHLEMAFRGGTSVYRRYELLDASGGVLVDSDYERALYIGSTLSFVVDDD